MIVGEVRALRPVAVRRHIAYAELVGPKVKFSFTGAELCGA
jgi:hypothetical protein